MPEEKPELHRTDSLATRKKPLTEPAPAEPASGRVRVIDGLDNSDLNMLLALAAEKAKRKEE